MAHSRRPGRQRNVVPDRIDLRDRPYQPSIAVTPPATWNSLQRVDLPVLDQQDTSACTGFALASVIAFLLRGSGHEPRAAVSPHMLYSMARRYDEFPGAVEEDSGSSLRGAMKGWYRHGACRLALWERPPMPRARVDPRDDWWQDAARRPLGAYYRVDTRSVTDMHVALAEIGILYASAVCHAGWDHGFAGRAAARRGFRIPHQAATEQDGGHAFAIVGYDREGFLVLNSWGRGWGDAGLAVLGYEDWLDHAMDCWVAQLGVVTAQHQAIAESRSLRADAAGRVVLSAEASLRDREIAPFVIDMENNGRLSGSGKFRTREADLEALLTIHLDQARRRFGLAPDDPVDVALYAHGGLTGEDAAAETAARWIPALYDAGIFPVFFMWETDLWSTLKNRLADRIHGEPRRTGGFRDALNRWWNQRVEQGLAAPGSAIWAEMKQNAEAISANAASGARILHRLSRRVAGFDEGRIRLHLIGHSAGSIVHCHLASRLAAAGGGWRFATVQFMAPAVRVDTFEATLLPLIRSGAVERYAQYHLTDAAEQQDPTCRPLLGYGRSLLYLVSESFERGRRTPILGLERHFAAVDRRGTGARIAALASPGAESASTTHGGFDDDPMTMASIIAAIRARSHRRAARAPGPAQGLTTISNAVLVERSPSVEPFRSTEFAAP